MPLTYRCPSPEDTFALGRQLAERSAPGFCALLYGDLGAGKTQFAKGFAAGLGLSKPVRSPTFAYVNRYPLPRSSPAHFYHYDLYRLHSGDDFSSIGLADSLAEPGAIHAIEWADRLGGDFHAWGAKVLLKAEGTIHWAEISFFGPQVPESERIEEAYAHWATPPHVRRHSAQVARIALGLAQAYADVGRIVDAELLRASALLHDAARVCDFRSLDRADFPEEVSDEQWSRWQALRQQFRGQDHPSLAAAYLAQKGFGGVARLVQAHGSSTLVLHPEWLDSLEAKILYYADKRVKHEQIVPLAERFRDGRERHGKKDAASRQLFAEVQQKALALEKELFSPLRIGPEDLG